MPVRDARMDSEVHPLVEYADSHIGEWVDFEVLDDKQLFRTVRWFVNSSKSPFGWSPDGKPQTALRSFDLMWQMPSGEWSRDIKTPGVYNQGLRAGRLKLRLKRSDS